jgi:hypothetical protein
MSGCRSGGEAVPSHTNGTKRATTDYGFDFGPMTVTRLMEFNGQVCIRIETVAGQEIEVYSSPTGRSLRAFRKGKGEMKP